MHKQEYSYIFQLRKCLVKSSEHQSKYRNELLYFWNKKRYNLFLQKNSTKLYKLSGSHIGIQGNEDVNRLVKLTTDTPINEIFTDLYTDLFEEFRKSASSQKVS